MFARNASDLQKDSKCTPDTVSVPAAGYDCFLGFGFFFLIRGLTESSVNGFFCSNFLSQRPVPRVPSPALSINAVGLFSPNKQAFLPKKIGSTMDAVIHLGTSL